MKDSPKEKIIKNAARCLVCNDIIVSKHAHHFVTCKCGRLSADEGYECLRGVGDFENNEE